MRKRKVRSRKTGNLKHFESLTPYMEKVSRGRIQGRNIYSLCVRASASKCFEFNLSVPGMARTKIAFFAMSALRGICEDLIVLRFLSQLPSIDRTQLLEALMRVEVAERMLRQRAFFGAIRPQQPVLSFKDVDAILASSEASARDVWRRHGWPNIQKGSMPQMRQIAEKQGMHHLAVLYEYLYRLTSSTVHFSVQTLLRSGWGKEVRQVRFSTRNFDAYFVAYCSLYGAFLFCLYFEFFSKVLRPNSGEREIINGIRQDVLFKSRWPEMVTFEEMNRAPPSKDVLQVLVSAFQSMSRKRLISKNADYTNESSSERKMMKAFLLSIDRADDQLKGRLMRAVARHLRK